MALLRRLHFTFLPVRRQYFISLCRRTRRGSLALPSGGAAVQHRLPAFLDSTEAMKPLQVSKSIPAWQRERAERLHRICSSIAVRHAHGEKKRKLIQWFAWYWKDRFYRCEPARPLRFTKSTIERALRIWKRGGQVAAALVPQYQPRRSVFTAPMLVRFVNYISSHPQPTMKAAWEKFAARGGNSGYGRRAGRPLKISYGQLQYNFSAAIFREIRAQHKAIEAAQARLQETRFKAIANITNLFPDRLPRRRVKREITFEI